MCVIAACKPHKRPTDIEIRAMFDANPDGAGIAWVENGTVNISKGYMYVSELVSAIHAVPDDSPLIIHCRIGTSGGYAPEVTHPYPITTDLDALHALDLTCPVAIAHNGVICDMPTNKKLNVSDTIAYIKMVIQPIKTSDAVHNAGTIVKCDNALNQVRKRALGNRFALLDYHGNLRVIGNGWSDLRSGIRISNRLFLTHVGTAKRKHDYLSKHWDDNTYAYRLPESCAWCEEYSVCRISEPLCGNVWQPSLYDWGVGKDR